MAWYDFLQKDAYQKLFERDRFERETEPRESWLTKAYERFRTGAELAEEAMVEPEIPIVKREKPGPREQLAHEYRDITTRARAGELSDEQYKFWWDTTPERVFGNVQAQGLGAGPRLRDVRGLGDIGAIAMEGMTPVVPEEATAPIRKIPVAGEILEPHIRGLTAPLGLVPAAKWPAITARMVGYGAAAGTAGKLAEKAGAPVAETPIGRWGPSGVGELAGTLAGPVAGPMAERAAVRGIKAAPAAGRATVAEIERLIPSARRVLAEEAGGLKPKKPPTPTAAPKPAAQAFREATEIRGVEGLELGLAEKFERAAGRANRVFSKEELTGDDLQRAVRAIVEEEFGHDPIITLYRGLHPGGKAGEAAGRWWSWRPFTAQRFAQRTPGTRGPVLSGELRASELANPELAGFIKSDSFELGPFLENKIRVKGVDPGRVRPTTPKATPALEEAPAWELGGMGTVEEMAGITETTAKANTGRLRALSGAEGGKPPPGKPPTATQPPSASDDILDYMLGAPKDEKVHRTLIRRYEGQVRVELDEADVLLRNILLDARKGGVKFSRTRTPEMERLIEAVDFQGPTEQAVRGLSVEEANLVRALHRIRDSETAKMLRDIPDFQARDFYWPHEYKLPKKPIKVPGRMKLGQKPGFMRQRKLEGTILENLAEKPNLDLVTWDPIEMIQRRIYNGVQYRQQFTLLNHMKRQGLALRRSKAPTEGWRTPKDVTAFNPRAVPGKPEVFTEPWMVPQDIAKAIEDHFGASMFSANVPLRALRETVATLKFVKTFGGLFQHFDYTLRVMANATKYRDVSTLGTIPRAWGRGYLPGLNAKMKAWDLKNPVRVALKEHGINVQAGMDFMGREYTQLAREMKLFKIPIVGRLLKNFGSATFRNAHEEYLLGTGERIVKNRMASGMSLDQAAAQTALDMNEVFSALPNWQSVLRNPTTRDITRVGIFSMAEQESWIRMPLRQKTFLASVVLTTAGLSNMVSLATTGKMLPLGAYKPFNIDLENKDIEYNVGFLRPELPYEGPDGRIEYLDILGQADTPFRFLGSPKFAIESRLGQIPGSALQAYRGRTWFGEKEISGPKEMGLFAAEQISPIPAAPYWEEHERIGTVGAIIQSIGLNVSAERLGSLFRRRFTDLTGEDWDKLDPSERKPYINQHPELLKLQAKRIEAGERYGGGWAQVDALDQDIEKRLLEAIASGQVTGEQVRDEFKDYQTQRSWLSQQTSAEWGEPEAKTPAHAAALEYWAIEVPVRNGVKDWDTFFAERKKVRDAHPELTDEWLRTNLAERFHEPQVRELIYQILEADAIADEYYSIPYKDWIPPEFQDAVREYVRQAQDIASLQGIPFEEALMQTGIEPGLIDLAVEYKKAPINPFRAMYWEQFPQKKALFYQFYRDVPLGIETEPEMAMAGGSR